MRRYPTLSALAGREGVEPRARSRASRRASRPGSPRHRRGRSSTTRTEPTRRARGVAPGATAAQPSSTFLILGAGFRVYSERLPVDGDGAARSLAPADCLHALEARAREALPLRDRPPDRVRQVVRLRVEGRVPRDFAQGGL